MTDNDRHEVHAFASFLRLVPPSLPDDWLKATLTEAANMNWEDEQLADAIARKRDGMWADSIRAALEKQK